MSIRADAGCIFQNMWCYLILTVRKKNEDRNGSSIPLEPLAREPRGPFSTVVIIRLGVVQAETREYEISDAS